MSVHSIRRTSIVSACGLSVFLITSGVTQGGPGDDPWADLVIDYQPGTGAAAAYADALTTLGIPERFTGEGVFPGAITAFNSAFGVDELVSIGEGGSLTVKFNTPVLDDSNNPYGIDLLVFGNALFIFDGGGVGNPAGLFADPGVIEVSSDGTNWFEVSGVFADDLYPTEGYLDHTDPFATTMGSVESVFTRPVDPTLQLGHFDGLSYAAVLDRYRGSGGGAGIDLASVGLGSISYVRISVPIGAGFNTEIDAFADVEARKGGDVNYDGVTDVDDLLSLLAGWGSPAPGSLPVDFDGDGFVTVEDLLILLANWG